jgi:hypothetical protein
MLRRCAVPDDQRCAVVPPGGTVGAQFSHGHAVRRGPRHGLGLALAGRQFTHRVQAGRDAGDTDLRDLAMQRGHEAIPAAAVGQAGTADMPVVGARADELGQHELVQAATRAIGEFLGHGHVGGQVGGQHQPAEAEGGSEALAGRAGVDHVLGRQRLDGTDRLAVVAELTVVVVLDDHSPGVPGPFHRAGPALRRERGPERELVRRGAQNRVGATRLVYRGAVGVDRHQGQVQPGGLHHGAVAGQAVRLGGQSGGTPGPQHLADQREPLSVTRAHDDAVGAGPDAAGAGQVAGQRVPQLRAALRVTVAENLTGRGEQRPAGSGQPGGTGEGGHVRGAGPQVVAQPAWRRGGGWCLVRLRGGPSGHPGTRSPGGGQPALGYQLAVRLGHRVAGDAQVGGQSP